jgi:hypothetical protein
MTRYRIEVQSTVTGNYDEYTSRKIPVDENMMRSLVAHLKRSGAGGRIVDTNSRLVVETWPRTYVPEELDATRIRIQLLREKICL